MKKVMKLTTLGFLLSLSVPAMAATSKYECDNLLFYAMDVKHKKEVRICISGKDIVYTFGNISVEKPELELKQKPSKTMFLYDINDGEDGISQGGSINFESGPYTYNVRGTASAEYEYNNKGLITVWKRDVEATKVVLDPQSIINNIKSNVDMYGIPVLEYD